MLKSIERLRISAINVVLVSAFLLGALIAAGLQRWQAAVYLGLLGICGLTGALYAHRSGSRDVTRLNGLEWRDERDRTLARSGFAVVGVVALLMVLAQFIVVLFTVTDPPSAFLLLTLAQILILFIAWGVANSIAVRRG